MNRPKPAERVFFSPRQRQVLELFREALPVKEIATRLGTSISSVYFHQAAMCGQIGIENDRGKLIKWACDHSECVDRGIAVRGIDKKVA